MTMAYPRTQPIPEATLSVGPAETCGSGDVMRSLLDRFGTNRTAWVAFGLMVLLAAAAVLAVPRGAVDVGRPGSGPGATGVASLDAYRGLGTWVDLYDTRAWADPAVAVRDMAGHGVRTLFIETANSSSTSGLVHPAELATFITEAHARHMFVVAWYLPNLRAGSVDLARITQAIDFLTPDGQRFDSFALDIESTAVKPVTLRNLGLGTLSKQVRDLVGPGYPLGAIIPSPVGLRSKKGYWSGFPYATLATTYDVILPMHYYTFSDHDPAMAYTSTIANMRELRAQPGLATSPVHMIGGISGASSAAEVRQLVRGARETGCIGASMYGWTGTSAAAWRELASVNASATP